MRIGLAARAIAAAPPAAGVPRQLAIAIRAACGIEALVWLTDVAQLSRRDASALMRSSAQALLNAALAT